MRRGLQRFESKDSVRLIPIAKFEVILSQAVRVKGVRMMPTGLELNHRYYFAPEGWCIHLVTVAFLL